MFVTRPVEYIRRMSPGDAVISAVSHEDDVSLADRPVTLDRPLPGTWYTGVICWHSRVSHELMMMR